MLTDWTEGSSITWEKNPDYRGYDEKYPENRLPYIDQLRALIMPEVATQLAALRTGKVDYLGHAGQTFITSIDQIESLQRTNPELLIHSYYAGSENSFGPNVQLPPFDDIRVRKALQMALDLETINNSYFKGYADIVPQGIVNRSRTDVVTQFEEWPEDVKKVFDYDPEGAEVLLDEAGYPRGADGIRFKTELMHVERYDLNLTQLVVSYWKKIGVDVEIEVLPVAPFVARRAERDFEINNANAAIGVTMGAVNRYTAAIPWAASNVNDPWYEAKFKDAVAATTIEKQNKIAGELNQYAIEKFWSIFGPIPPQTVVIQPWLKGYNGEWRLADSGQDFRIFTRLWIDSELKEAMGR